MSHWNHRVMHKLESDGSHSYTIHEVYYDVDGAVTGWTENGIAPYGETLEELRSDLKRMVKALSKPVLEDK